jgi:hypothetical protein
LCHQAFAPQECQQRQQREAKDGKMVSLNALEQVDAELFKLIGADTRQGLPCDPTASR